MKNGFTLIEIIIVIIIIGIQATLALPRLVAQLEVGRAGEALLYMGVLKNQALNCYDANQSMARCNAPAFLGVTAPASARFTYTYSNNGDDEFRVLAHSRANTANCIKMSVLGSTGLIGMSGFGDLTGIVGRASPNLANGTTGTACTAY
jgi:prepilin-type N-terminal cleavage/methylation domain-containing protein